MAHNIQCIIGPQKAVQDLADAWVHAHPLDLKEDFSLIPLKIALIEDINELANAGEEQAHEAFHALSKSMELVLKDSSFEDKIAYIETDYFGGNGNQSAISYFKGKVFQGPLKTISSWDAELGQYIKKPKGERAINAILYGMGLAKITYTDGFDQLGLRKYRSNEAILRVLGKEI